MGRRRERDGGGGERESEAAAAQNVVAGERVDRERGELVDGPGARGLEHALPAGLGLRVRVLGLGLCFRVQGLLFGVQGLGFRV